ncbi:hypothetical protein N7470_003748 [Penicillium chermesinum]|nr:hypothetical protein N7470_003748 [Penicillium chermesinum]
MAALVQTIPQQSGTVPVLQTRPSSSSGTFASSHNSGPRYQNMSWTSFNAGNSGSYRSGHQVVAPYAFPPNVTHTPNHQHRQSWSPSPHLRPEHRTFSAPQGTSGPHPGSIPRGAHAAAGSVSNSSSSNSSFRSHVSKDDSAIPSRQSRPDHPLRPLSTANLPPVMTASSSASPAKPSPNRYRRSNQRDGARSQSPAPSTPTNVDDQTPASLTRPVLRPNGHTRVSSVDDSSHLERQPPDTAKRYRRRSMGNMDPGSYPDLQLQMPPHKPPRRLARMTLSLSTRHLVLGLPIRVVKVQGARGPSPDPTPASKPEEKRAAKPSPLSQPATSPESPSTEADTKTLASPTPDSPAAKRLAELKNDAGKRPGKSRLRRAFSFGSASELLKATSQSKREAIAAEKARKEALREELGDEQAAIAEQQEASGLGESIYSHQGNFFTGSTDALSISSTASSASMMLRKMGKGMKKGTRSLVGMFRPKSIASINEAEAQATDTAAPQISVVNVEADRESVAVNPDPQDMPRGGGDHERAEVLSHMRRGILKKTNSDGSVPVALIGGNDSPHSSAPATPDETSRQSPRPTEQVTIAGEDYFLSTGGRYTSTDAKSAPITPQTVGGRNIVFSPRIQFHETWPSGEYDRRGEIATCNRLTPLLAQQIREEINNFKMEMEVHENSKIYTHFI